jgi:hypothetical protein
MRKGIPEAELRRWKTSRQEGDAQEDFGEV